MQSNNVFSVSTGADVVLVISNLFFLVPSIKAAQLHRYTYSAIYFLIIFASGSYHMCDSFSATCVFDATTHQMVDFFFAQLIIPLTAFYIIYFPPAYRWVQRWCIIAMAVVLFVLEVTIGMTFIIQVILCGVSFLIIAVYWISYAIYQKEMTGHPHIPYYDWNNFFWGIALTVVAVVLFVTQSEFPPGYWAVHSIWHISAAIGQYFILSIRPAESKWAAVDKRIHQHFFAQAIRG